MTGRIIPFDSRERLLSQVRSYVTAVDALIRDGDRAVDLLLKGFPLADDDLKVKIVIMLGLLANERVAWSLLEIMCDCDLGDSVRQAAAIQISVIGCFLSDAEALVDRLLGELDHPRPFNRSNAVFALGWEGNLKAAPSLIESLSDDDVEVQQAAVSALSNLRDDRLFSLLARHLQMGSKEQQRTILYHLGNFSSRHDAVAKICTTFTCHGDADLRVDALVVLNGIGGAAAHLSVYQHCLGDDDPRVREAALSGLAAVERDKLHDLLPSIRPLAGDRSAGVRQAATRLLHDIDAISIAPGGTSHEPI
jgi:HEAT repeat protein